MLSTGKAHRISMNLRGQDRLDSRGVIHYRYYVYLGANEGCNTTTLVEG